MVDWSVVWWLCFLTSRTQFLAGLFCQGEGVQFCEQVEHIVLLLCSDGDYITPVSTKLSFTHRLLPVITHVEQFHKKGPHLNTLERFHIHKVGTSHNHLNDEHTITPNRIFDTILNIDS